MDFYDEAGKLVGRGVRKYGRGPVFNRKPLAFSVRADAAAPSATSALVAITSLVQE